MARLSTHAGPEATDAATNRAVVEVRRGWKSYGGTPALVDVDFSLAAGEVHVLAGPNGAGKSTLVKVLGGVVGLDRGQTLVDGERHAFRAPKDALAAGVAVVSQEGSLVPTLSVAENIALGGRHSRGAFGIDWRATRARAAELLRVLGEEIDVTAPVSAITPGERQVVEIVRAMSLDTRALVLDEPTTFLDAAQTARLFEIVTALRGAGKAVLIISHRLEEMLRVGDRFTVMRDGRVVASAPVAEVDEEWLVTQMTAGMLHAGTTATPVRTVDGAERPVVVSVRNLWDAGSHVRGASFDVRAGEVVGLTGVVGSGQTELLDALFGARPRVAGEVFVAGRPVGKNPLAAIRAGIGLVPEDRRGQALVGQASVRENMVMAARAAHRRRSGKAERRDVNDWCQRLAVKTPGIDTRVDRLSGGNQQKVVIARWLMLSPRLLLLNEPTRGIDVAGKRDIYRLIRDLTAEGTAVIFVSSEIDEVIELSHRVLVMRRGSVVHDVPRHLLSTSSLTALANGFAVDGIGPPEESDAAVAF